MSKKKSSQIAVVPIRKRDGRHEVCLVTTRTTKRWVVPKGWSEKGMAPHRMAAQEAYEEAGLRGKVGKLPVGSYEYFKRLERTFELVSVDVFVMHVETELTTWPETSQRKRRWFSKVEAAWHLNEPGLVTVLKSL